MKMWQRALGADTPARSGTGTFGVQDWVDMWTSGAGMLNTTMGSISDEELTGTIAEAYRSNGPVFALVLARMQIFSQARFQWTRWSSGTPRDLFGTPELGILETPWPGGTTADLLSRMEVYGSAAGNAFVRRIRRGRRGTPGYVDRLAMMRPEWTTIVLGSQEDADHPAQASDVEILGYAFKPNGDASKMQLLLPEEVAHYAPIPDPDMNFRGMSWISPVINEVQSDDASELHKRKFFQNAATPNLAIKFDPTTPVQDVKAFKALLEDEHRGIGNAWKTMYLGGGADPVAIGKDFQQLAFAATQGKGESRLASAAGVPPSWVGFSEGLQGSALNAGNFTAARRRMADGTMHHLWCSAASALQTIVDRPKAVAGETRRPELWHDVRSIPFLREDSKEHAETQAREAETMRTLIEAGFDPDTVVTAVRESDYTLLKHTGRVSVQLQQPGTTPTSPTPAATTGGTT